MTIIGNDRPGLVESVARIVTDHGGNWLESRMAQLAGQFAGILHVEVPAAQEAELTTALKTLEGQGLSVVIQSGAPAAAPSSADLISVEIIGHDRPGTSARSPTPSPPTA